MVASVQAFWRQMKAIDKTHIVFQHDAVRDMVAFNANAEAVKREPCCDLYHDPIFGVVIHFRGGDTLSGLILPLEN